MRARRLENDFTETATVCRAAAHRDLLSDAVSVSASFHASFELQCLCPLKHMCVQVSESENSGLLSL